MNISGIRPSEGFYSYNSIKINELRAQQITASKQEAAPTLQSADNETADISAQLDDARSKQTFSSADYAAEYNPSETYELKGVDSDINSLDIQKAVSDMDKDKMLQQYQMFVGSASEIVSAQSEGSIISRPTENFTL